MAISYDEYSFMNVTSFRILMFLGSVTSESEVFRRKNVGFPGRLSTVSRVKGYVFWMKALLVLFKGTT